MKNADLPAMPIERSVMQLHEGERLSLCTGLTKRETFAIHAMQGLLSGGEGANSKSIFGAVCNISHEEMLSHRAIALADALLRGLEK